MAECGCRILGIDSSCEDMESLLRPRSSTSIIHCPRHSESNVARLEARVKELETVLSAWHSQFGTTQLYHATDRLRAAEDRVQRLARRVRVLEEGLRRHGRHDRDCKLCRCTPLIGHMELYHTSEGHKASNCTCGFATLLTTGGVG